MEIRFKRGDRIRVPYGAGVYDATVVGVRDGRIYVAIDLDSDASVETFYRSSELVDA
ncbi:hypothetical protein BN000_02184 [Mycobacterium europaeum]|uniref:Uncharacterized protein n=1 Tax=Mycobacterium europaeum TaxID=761804 RepID=A0A0U1D933_9MYCO|nr:hypothetical protein [Mycobacterium europaeum]CQD10582.1 hypothetical protein BN000_02184 [Mycobacterium europaeum]